MLFWSRHTWSSRFKATNGGCENAKSVTDAAISPSPVVIAAVLQSIERPAPIPPAELDALVRDVAERLKKDGLRVFDAPDNNLSCPARERSTTAPQSLTQLNADEVTVAAKLTEARLMKEAGSNDGRITMAYRLVLGRPPSAKEQELARAFLAQSPLREFCRALFNLNDFVYAE